MNIKHFTIYSLKNYLGKYSISKNQKIKCCTKKQLNAISSKKERKFLGEYKPGTSKDEKDCIADINIDNNTLYLNSYKKNNRLLYAEKGYLKCGEDSYIILLKNVFLKRIIILLISLALIITASAAFYNIYTFKNNVDNLLNIDPNATDWNNNLNTDSSVSHSTKIPGFGSLTLPKDTTNVSISLGNPAENSCYFVISITLEDGTELFKSELIPPGKGLTNITLSKPLNPGEYNAIVKYQTFNLDTQREMNGADMNIKIFVQ